MDFHTFSIQDKLHPIVDAHSAEENVPDMETEEVNFNFESLVTAGGSKFYGVYKNCKVCRIPFVLRICSYQSS